MKSARTTAYLIVMELLETNAIREVQKGPLSLAEALPNRIRRSRGIRPCTLGASVHRDFKPSNVFLTPHSVKLLDFGLARPEPEPSLHSSDQSHTAPRGPCWALQATSAPERVRQWGGRRPQCDGASAILFELLAGRGGVWGPNRRRYSARHAPMNSLRRSPAIPRWSAHDRVIRRALPAAGGGASISRRDGRRAARHSRCGRGQHRVPAPAR